MASTTTPAPSTTISTSANPPTASSPATALAAKTAEAAHAYAHKNYVEAADLYSQATALQCELNGEMAPENAELLYAYGRALYKVAVEKSDVLGGKVAGPSAGGAGAGGRAEKQQQQRGKKRKIGDEEESAGPAAAAATATASSSSLKEAAEKVAPEPAAKKDNTPYFQIEGDDPDWDSDESGGEGVEEDDDEAEAAAAEEEEEDDLATAYEILDTARVLLIKRLETLDEAAPNEPDNAETPSATSTNGASSSTINGKEKVEPKNIPTKRHIQDLLADTYDLQSEISLENERFPDAASDAKSSLALKLALHPFDSSLVAEAHYKVSLALEFAAKTTSEKPDELTGEIRKEVEGVDELMMREAARHMELAIESTRGRVEREGREAEACRDAKERRGKRAAVAEVKEIVADMEERLRDLRAAPTALSTTALDDPALAALASGLGGAAGGGNLGLLGALLGESPAAAREKIEEATKSANDLTGLVRRGRKKGGSGGGGVGGAEGVKQVEVNGGAEGSGAKRKSPAGEEVEGAAEGSRSGKKARVEDAEGVDELA